VSLWILAVLARPLTGPRLTLVVGVSVLMLLACTVPFARAFFAMDLRADLPLAWGLACGVVGAAGVEALYRFARRRGLVFDRE
jgi:cation-transporting ATPase E